MTDKEPISPPNFQSFDIFEYFDIVRIVFDNFKISEIFGDFMRHMRCLVNFDGRLDNSIVIKIEPELMGALEKYKNYPGYAVYKERLESFLMGG